MKSYILVEGTMVEHVTLCPQSDFSKPLECSSFQTRYVSLVIFIYFYFTFRVIFTNIGFLLVVLVVVDNLVRVLPNVLLGKNFV